MFAGYFLILIASFFLGSFGIGMKYNKPLAWENFWSIHVLVGMIIVPVIWALLVVPNLWQVIFSSPSGTLLKCMFFGFLWGIGGMLFGLSVKYVGVSLTYGVVMGVCGVLGSVVPLFQIPDVSSKAGFTYVLIGNFIMLVGVAFCAAAGIKREKRHSAAGTIVEDIQSGKGFKKGLFIVIASGILSSFINIGFANAGPIIANAAAMGTLPRNASLAAWVVILFGAFLFNAVYAIVELSRNKTWHLYKAPKSANAYKWAIISALLFFGYAGLYGQGTVLLGNIGPIVGWPILLSLSLIFSNLWGVKTGEWKGNNSLLRLIVAGVLSLIIASLILTYANTFMNN